MLDDFLGFIEMLIYVLSALLAVGLIVQGINIGFYQHDYKQAIFFLFFGYIVVNFINGAIEHEEQ